MRLAATCVAALALAGCAQQGSVITPGSVCAGATVGLAILNEKAVDGPLSSSERSRGVAYLLAGDANCPADDPAWRAVRDLWA